MEYGLPAFIASMGAASQKSTVEGINNQIGICYYLGLAAQPSTGKSNAQSLSQKATTNIEDFMKVPAGSSIQVNAPTIEALFRILSKTKNALCNKL